MKNKEDVLTAVQATQSSFWLKVSKLPNVAEVPVCVVPRKLVIDRYH